MRRRRSLRVCPCWRCREARREERERPTPEEMRVAICRMIEWGKLLPDVPRDSAQGWSATTARLAERYGRDNA